MNPTSQQSGCCCDDYWCIFSFSSTPLFMRDRKTAPFWRYRVPRLMKFRTGLLLGPFSHLQTFFFLFISPFLHPPVLQNVAKYESSISEGDGIWTLDTFFQMWIFCMSKSLFFPLLACIIKINGSLRCTGSLHGYISSPTLFTRVILYKRQQLRMLNCSPSATCSAHLSREEKLTLSTFLQP